MCGVCVYIGVWLCLYRYVCVCVCGVYIGMCVLCVCGVVSI